jgi:hypothetical protein
MTDGYQSPDFSDLDSLRKVQGRCAAGALEKLYLVPFEFGGRDIEE